MDWSPEAALLLGLVLWALPYLPTTNGGRKLPTTKKEETK